MKPAYWLAGKAVERAFLFSWGLFKLGAGCGAAGKKALVNGYSRL